MALNLKHALLAKASSAWKQVLVWRWSRQPSMNCWFCNEDFVIESHQEGSGWVCPGCQQYNGFNEDGDYDRLIPEQYGHEAVGSKVDKSFCQRENVEIPDSILCRPCYQNQALKVGQLASFVPLSESSYNEEVEAYGRYLESVYRLCQRCKDKLRLYLTRQDENIFERLDQDSLQIQRPGLQDGGSLGDTEDPAKLSLQAVIRCSLFSLCLFMAVMNTMFVIKMCVEGENRWLNAYFPPRVLTAVLYVTSVIPLPAVQGVLQLPVFLGTGMCLLGLLAVGKNCVYVVDALHILHWLALLITRVLSPFPAPGASTVGLDLILCLATTAMCLVCLTVSRQPREFGHAPSKSKSPKRVAATPSEENLHAARIRELSTAKTAVTASHVLPSPIHPSPPSSPATCLVGEAKNFFKPISFSPPGSPASVSPSPSSVDSSHNLSNTSFHQDGLKSSFDVVRDGLESFSLGLARKSGSMSSIWSLPPSLISSDSLTSPDSTLPTDSTNINNNNTATTEVTDRNITDPVARAILSPSRLGFLSFSLPPTPGKFSSSSPVSDPDSGYSPDASHRQQSQSSDISSSSKGDSQTPPKLAKEPSPPSQSTVTSAGQKQSFTKYRDESQSFSVKPQWKLDDNFFQSSVKPKEATVVPDSTSIDPVGRPVRRSSRIAMQGKIVRPWPLKKSLSVNNMYDSPQGIDFLKGGSCKSVSVTQEEPLENKSWKSDVSGSSARPLDRVASHSSGGYLEKIDEFSDDEDLDGPSRNRRRGRTVMRGQVEKAQSQWIWTLVGMVIGISVTVNVFLGIHLWANKSPS